MTRILAALFSLLLIGAAAAQPPVDYTLLCDGEVIGTASYVDGQLHVAVLAGATCEDPSVLSVAEDATLVLAFAWVEDVLTVTIEDPEGELMSGVAIEVPEQAIAGMVGAAKNRTAAAERRGHGQATAAAMRELHQKPELPELPELPEFPELPIVLDPPVPPVPFEAESFGQHELPVEPPTPGGRRP